MKSWKRSIPLIVLVLLCIGSAALAATFYARLHDLKTNPQKNAQSEERNLIERIGRLMILPAGEQPTVATVSDPDRLRDQAFFAQAEKGDKVLIYTKARKAILYRPSSDKIVEVAPVNLGNPPAGVSTTAGNGNAAAGE